VAVVDVAESLGLVVAYCSRVVAVPTIRKKEKYEFYVFTNKLFFSLPVDVVDTAAGLG
jgi:hypothetical protein